MRSYLVLGIAIGVGVGTALGVALHPGLGQFRSGLQVTARNRLSAELCRYGVLPYVVSWLPQGGGTFVTTVA
jgi:hypothetical protein